MPPELGERVGAPVGELVLREPPDALIGVELRRVAGEAKEMEPGEHTAEGADRVSLVDRAAVPEQQDRSSEMAEQMTQEATARLLLFSRWSLGEHPLAQRIHRDHRA